ncbi:MAG: hypothetical protein RL839_07370 [Gammaproteobacteria bacterium]
MKNQIASRELLVAEKGSGARKPLKIMVGSPYLLKEGMVDFPFSAGTSGCRIEIEGLHKTISHETYGADPIQALELALATIDSTLQRYELDYYFPNGEPYFENEKSSS